MSPKWNNNTIICVDDEESVRDIYRKILAPITNDPLEEILSLAGDSGRGDPGDSAGRVKPDFNVLLASSGEEAIRMITEEMDKGNRVAAGFFDMRMPGGMDGYETIEKVRQLDHDLICCVVTAYTDREVTEIRSLFTDEHQDELLYVKKPFSVDEMEQGAVNMVSAWNRKRKIENHVRAIEKQKNGLRQILHAVSTFSKIPPHSLESLISGLFFQVLGIVEGGLDGYCVFSHHETFESLGYGTGKFELCDNLLQVMNETPEFDRAFKLNRVIVDKTYCYMPFINNGSKLGGMYIRSGRSILNYLDRELLEVFKNQVVTLIMNSMYHKGMVEKEKDSITDPLTGLYNRRFFFQRFTEELNRIQRQKVSITMMMVDIDHFKNVNDQFGHDTGDYVLKSLGKILRQTVRTYDLVGNQVSEIGNEEKFVIRYGGEEFGAILLDTDNQGALIAAERLRKKVEAHVFHHRNNDIRLTVSIGLYTKEFLKNQSDQQDFLSDIYRKADEATYQAKDTGRNKIVVYESKGNS